MKTVKVRIAAAVRSNGDWIACGWEGIRDGGAMDTAIDNAGEDASRYWITAELPVPEVPEVPTFAGTVEVAQ